LRTTKLITISLPPELLKKIERLARRENRTRSELLRETVRQYLAREEWLELNRYALSTASKAGIETEDDIDRIVGENRSGK